MEAPSETATTSVTSAKATETTSADPPPRASRSGLLRTRKSGSTLAGFLVQTCCWHWCKASEPKFLGRWWVMRAWACSGRSSLHDQPQFLFSSFPVSSLPVHLKNVSTSRPPSLLPTKTCLLNRSTFPNNVHHPHHARDMFRIRRSIDQAFLLFTNAPASNSVLRDGLARVCHSCSLVHCTQTSYMQSRSEST